MEIRTAMHLKNIFNLKCSIAVACQVERNCCLRPHRAVPENVHTQRRLMEIPRGRGFQKPNVLKEDMKLNWNFQVGGG